MVHIRRCHICNKTSESETQKIERCESCGKYLAPFMFCNDPSDPSEAVSNAKDQVRTSQASKSFLKSEYPPILGISLYW